MQSKSEQMAQNFKGGVYKIYKSFVAEDGSRNWAAVEDGIKGKKNAVKRADDLQRIARKENQAAGRSYKMVTYYWVTNINTGTIAYQP